MTHSRGISIIMCGYNSSRLLPDTLNQLAKLRLPQGFTVELVLVDNASTDNTAQVASETWEANGAPYPMRLFREDRQGLIFARKRGLTESRFGYILFVDDDNRPDENYLVEMVSIFENSPDVAVAGGINEGVFESEKPDWFDDFEHSFAVGRLADDYGEPEEIGLFGAGLCLRREAWNELVNHGFESRLVGRSGKSLSSGEDYELCKALKIAGWEVLFSPRLKLRHFITAPRLNWKYLLKLNRGISHSIICFLAYEYHIAKIRNPGSQLPLIRLSRPYLLAKKSVKTAILKLKLSLNPKLKSQGSTTLVEYQRTRIVIADLLQKGKEFRKLKSDIGKAGWKGIHTPTGK